MALWGLKDHLAPRGGPALKVTWVLRVRLVRRVTWAPRGLLVRRVTWAPKGLLVHQVCRAHLVPGECRGPLTLMPCQAGLGLRGSRAPCLRDL